MKIKRIICIFGALCFFIGFQPLYVLADRCDDAADQAGRLFEAAKAASNNKEYDRAIQLYEEAETSYQSVAEMRNCRCPKIAGSARQNVSICRQNIVSIQEYTTKERFIDVYNQATIKFNEGNSYARNKQWDLAVSSFEEADRIWGSIASTDTENGRRALNSAKQARGLAELARKEEESESNLQR